MDSFNLDIYGCVKFRSTPLNHDYRLRIYRHYNLYGCIVFSHSIVSLFASSYFHCKSLCILIEASATVFPLSFGYRMLSSFCRDVVVEFIMVFPSNVFFFSPFVSCGINIYKITYTHRYIAFHFR